MKGLKNTRNALSEVAVAQKPLVAGWRVVGSNPTWLRHIFMMILNSLYKGFLIAKAKTVQVFPPPSSPWCLKRSTFSWISKVFWDSNSDQPLSTSSRLYHLVFSFNSNPSKSNDFMHLMSMFGQRINIRWVWLVQWKAQIWNSFTLKNNPCLHF